MRVVLRKSVARAVCRYWGFPCVLKSNPNHYVQGHFAAGREGKRKLGHAAHLRAVFKDATDPYVGKEITNKATGIKAVFSKESQKEISGNTALSKTNGFGIAKHFEVANQVIELFENATLVNRHADTKHGDKNVSIERFLSQPVTLKSGEAVQACITVKHTRNPDGRNLYSLEAMSVENALEKTRAKGQHPASTEASPLSPAASISKALEKTSGKPLRSHLMIKKSVADEICRYWGFPLVRKSNTHHDARGRFSSGAGSLDVGSCVKDQHGAEHTIQRKVKTQGGNFVFIAYTKSEGEERDNLAACEVLADKLGWTCVLLPRSNLVKTADMLNASGREFWEIKTNRTGTANSVKKEMKRGSEQSENVIIRFDTEKLSAADFSYEKMKQEVVKRKREFTKLKKIMLITGERIELIP